jgi:hypothetical protein
MEQKVQLVKSVTFCLNSWLKLTGWGRLSTGICKILMALRKKMSRRL